MSEKKQELFDKMVEAVISYKEEHTSENAATRECSAARKATEPTRSSAASATSAQHSSRLKSSTARK